KRAPEACLTSLDCKRCQRLLQIDSWLNIRVSTKQYTRRQAILVGSDHVTVSDATSHGLITAVYG
ncbi:MAG: hypothetical protein ACO3FE_14180, partial [Planctomycetaceae bacterium]